MNDQNPLKKVWIYQSNDFLSSELNTKISIDSFEFLKKWNYHGKKVDGKIEIMHDLFLVIQADVQISGCGIDQSLHFVGEIEKKYNIVLTDRMQVAFEKENKVYKVHLNTLKNLYQTQIIEPQTIFFNNLVNNSLMLETNWKIPLQESWHFRFCK